MTSLDLAIPNARGVELSAKLDLPETGDPAAFALFAHCFTCSKNLNAVRNVARSLAERGIGTLRFDFTGLGSSGGDFADSTFATDTEDLVAAAAGLAARYGPPSILVGHSLGGAAVLHAARRIDSVRAVATIGAPAEPAHVTRLFASSLDDIEADGFARVSLAGRPFTITRSFVEDLDRTRLRPCIADLGRPLLVMHAPDDDTVEFSNAESIFADAAQPKSMVALDGADHLLTRARDSRYVGSVIAAWAARYVDGGDTRDPADA